MIKRKRTLFASSFLLLLSHLVHSRSNDLSVFHQLGNLNKFIDHSRDKVTLYKYDDSGRMTNFLGYDSEKNENLSSAWYVYDDYCKLFYGNLEWELPRQLSDIWRDLLFAMPRGEAEDVYEKIFPYIIYFVKKVFRISYTAIIEKKCL